MKTEINPKNQYKKGEMLVNTIGWACIVMEATRGYNPTIIPMVEVFGFEHECGSIYTNEIARRITKEEFEEIIKANGNEVGDYYFKGKLIDPVE